VSVISAAETLPGTFEGRTAMRTRKLSPGSPYAGGGSTLPCGIAIDGDDTVWVFNVGATKVDIGGPPPPAPDRTSNWKLDADPFLNPFGISIVIAFGAPPRRSRRR
jgi:hypothetical protein